MRVYQTERIPCVKSYEALPIANGIVLHGEQYSRGTVARITKLARRGPREIRKHGSEHHQRGHGESRENTGPESDAAVGQENGGFLAGKRQAGLIRQDRAHGDSQQKPARPNKSDS